MANVRGSCLCGGVKFEIVGPLMRVLNCHCSKCRKQHSAAFRSRARVGIEDFLAARRGARALLPIVTRLLPGVLRRLRLADHQQIEPPRVWCPAGHTRRRPERAADAPLLCRKQGAVVRHHRYSSSISGAARLLLKTAADRVWPRSSAPRLGTRCCAVSRPKFRALDLALDQTQDYRRRRKRAYSWASLERRSKRWRACSQ
jgi:hypothetical protein